MTAIRRELEENPPNMYLTRAAGACWCQLFTFTTHIYEVSLTGDELINAVSQRFGLSDPKVIDATLTGCDVGVEEKSIRAELQ